MSYILTLSGRESLLTLQLYPPIILNETQNYELGLINFVTYNTIPNVDSTNNNFYFGTSAIQIPEGTYEIKDIAKIISGKVNMLQKPHPTSVPPPILLSSLSSSSSRNQIKKIVNKDEEEDDDDDDNEVVAKKKDGSTEFIKINTNQNTLRCEIKGTQDIYFDKPNSLANILGFEKRTLSANKVHISDYPINISKVNAVCCECNLVTNSYNNNKPSHILHMFYPTVPPGYKIVETPSNVIYLPINTRYLDEVIIKITDQDGNLINFNRELITIRVHLRPISQ